MNVIDYESTKILEQPPSQNSGGKNLKEGFEAQEIRCGYLEKMECRMNNPAHLHQPLKAIHSHFQNKRDSYLVKRFTALSYVHAAFTLLVDLP